MTPPKQSRLKWSIEIEAEAVLGRNTVRAQDLLRLIHDVNPTGAELPPKAERRRYALKSRLQSRLVRDFRDELSVECLPGQEEIVGLRYRPDGQDACHARVAELDEDARAWVRMTYDIGIPAGNESELKAKSSTQSPRAERHASDDGDLLADDPGALVLLGQAALKEYDFDAARGYFEEAFELSDGGERPAIALLEFLVENVAAYREALECKPGLSVEAGRNQEVCALLGVAAANLSRVPEALEVLKRAGGPRAAEAFVLLGNSALASGDFDEAQRLLDEAKDRWPAHSGAPALATEIRQRRAAARRPSEDELVRVALVGDDALTAPHAAALLEQWPDSAVARRLLRDLETRSRVANAEKFRVQGERAFAAGDLERAASCLRTAAELGVVGLSDRIAAVASAVENLRSRKATARVCESLTLKLSSETLRKYAALEPTERKEVRRETGHEVLTWLEDLGGAQDHRRCAGVIDAVLALWETSQLVAPVPEVVLGRLEPHEQSMSRISCGREMMAKARAAQRAELLKHIDEEVVEVGKATAAGRVDEALSHMRQAASHARSKALNDGGRQLAGKLDLFLDQLGRHRQLNDLLSAGDTWKALEFARQALEDGPESEREHWLKSHSAVVQRARAEAQVQVYECAAASSAPSSDLVIPNYTSAALDGDGRHLYVAIEYCQRLSIWVYGMKEQRVVRLVTLRAPGDMMLVEALVHGGSLWLMWRSGGLLELALSSFDVLTWRSEIEVAEGECIRTSFHIPGTRFTWLTVELADGLRRVQRVVDVKRSKVHREIRTEVGAGVLWGPGGARVFTGAFDRSSRVFSADGTPLQSLPPGIHLVAELPGANGILGISGANGAEGASLIGIVDSMGRANDFVEVPGSRNSARLTVATSYAEESVFVLCQDGLGATWLSAYQWRAGALHRAFGIQVPERSQLVRDGAGGRVALLSQTNVGSTIVMLAQVSPSPPMEAGDREIFFARRLEAIRAADELLSVGDGVRAQALLDCALTWSEYDCQIGARLAEAVLLQPDEASDSGFRKRLCLLAYAAAYGLELHPKIISHDIGELARSAAQLAETYGAAARWLGGLPELPDWSESSSGQTAGQPTDTA